MESSESSIEHELVSIWIRVPEFQIDRLIRFFEVGVNGRMVSKVDAWIRIRTYLHSWVTEDKNSEFVNFLYYFSFIWISYVKRIYDVSICDKEEIQPDIG